MLAQNDTGSIDLNNIPDNHGFRLWLEDYGEVIQAAQNREIFTEQAEKSARVWEIIGKIQQFRKGDTPELISRFYMILFQASLHITK